MMGMQGVDSEKAYQKNLTLEVENEISTPIFKTSKITFTTTSRLVLIALWFPWFLEFVPGHLGGVLTYLGWVPWYLSSVPG